MVSLFLARERHLVLILSGRDAPDRPTGRGDERRKRCRWVRRSV